jgi:hypothetical protein
MKLRLLFEPLDAIASASEMPKQAWEELARILTQHLVDAVNRSYAGEGDADPAPTIVRELNRMLEEAGFDPTGWHVDVHRVLGYREKFVSRPPVSVWQVRLRPKDQEIQWRPLSEHKPTLAEQFGGKDGTR